MPYLQSELIGLIVAMIIYAIFMIWFLLHLLRHFRKKEVLHEEQLMLERFRAEKELYQAQLELQEQTLAQVSREIHDNVGQFLSLAKLGLTTIDLDKKEEAEIAISEITDILEKSLSDLRDLSKAMNSDLVKKLGLRKAIESQIGFIERMGSFHVQFACEGNMAQSNPQKEIILYRILQESITNIIKHSGANEITIFLSSFKNELKLQVADNGYGFDTDLALAGSTRIGGLQNMKGRADFINAKFSVESKIGQGTKIIVTTTI